MSFHYFIIFSKTFIQFFSQVMNLVSVMIFELQKKSPNESCAEFSFIGQRFCKYHRNLRNFFINSSAFTASEPIDCNNSHDLILFQGQNNPTSKLLFLRRFTDFKMILNYINRIRFLVQKDPKRWETPFKKRRLKIWSSPPPSSS